jgi:hypothetical protein
VATLAHLALDGHVLWYPFVALAVPVLIIVLLTRHDAARHRATQTPAERSTR